MPGRYKDPTQQMLFAWTNSKIKRAGGELLEDVATGFEDGLNLALLINEVTGRKTVHKLNKDPKILARKLDNIQKCLDALEVLGLDIVDICGSDIQQGNEKMIFALLFKIMCEFENQDAAEMYVWVQQQIETQLPEICDSIDLDSFTDGVVFAALANSIERCIDLDSLNKANKVANLRLAFEKIEELIGVPQALQPETVATNPDEVRVLSYLGLIKTQFADASQRAQARVGTIAEGTAIAAAATAPVSSTPQRQVQRQPQRAFDPSMMYQEGDIVFLNGGAYTGRSPGWKCTVREDRGDKVLVCCEDDGEVYIEPKTFIASYEPRTVGTVLDAHIFDGIEVTVKEAKNLKNMETFGKMSPYSVIWVNFEPHEKSTNVHARGGVAPQWNETLSWQARGQIPKLRMKVIVWDKESFGFDDYVGGADIGVHTMVKGQSIEKWIPITQHTQSAGSVLVRIKIK
jgi:hypothetical protein